MVSPVGSSSKSFFTPSSSSQLGTVYLNSGAGDRISLSGKRSSENEALAKAVTTLKVTERALGKLVDIADKMLSLTGEATNLSTSEIQRQGLNRKFNALVNDFRGVLAKTKEVDGVDLTDRDAFDDTLAKAGLVKQIGGTIGALISVLGGEDKELATEEITIEGFKFQDEGTTKRFQQTFGMLLNNMTGVRISNDAKKGGSEVSGTTLIDSGSPSVLFGSSANYLLNNAAHYGGIANASDSTTTPTVTYNAAPPSADFTILDADSAGRYTATFNDDGATEKIQFYDRLTNTVVRDLLILSGGGAPQAAISGDGNNLVYYEDTGSAATINFSNDQGATSSAITVIGGTIEGRVAASDTIAVFSSNATSLGADGTAFDLFLTDGYSSPATTRINIKGLEIGATLNTDSISVSNDGSTVAFSISTPDENGKLYLYDVGSGACSFTGLTDVIRTSLDDDGSRIAVSSTATGAAAVSVYDISLSPASSAVYTLSSESPGGQISFASVLGASSDQGYFSTTTNYLGLNTANKASLAEATNAGGVTDLSLATESNMRIQSIDDAGQYGIVTLGRWVDGAAPSSSTGYNVIWNFVNDTQVSQPSISVDAHAEISADGNYWASIDLINNEVHWGGRLDDFSSGGALGGNVAVSNNRFAFVSNEAAFGGDGSRWDLIYSDGFGGPAAFTAISAGLTEDVVHDTSNYNTIAISDDGNRIAFVGATTGEVFLYDVNLATKFDTGLQLDLSQGAKFSIDLNSDGTSMVIADESTDTVSLYGMNDPSAPASAGTVQLTNGDALDAKRVFLDASGQNISFAADLGEGRVEVFEAAAAVVGTGTSQISYEGQTHDISYTDMNVSLVTTEGVVSTADDTFFASTGSNLVLSSRANYLSSNADQREALWHADSGGIASEETTLATEADRADQYTYGISSDGSWGIRLVASGLSTVEFYELSTGKVGTSYDMATASHAISPDGTKGTFGLLGSMIYLSSDVQHNGDLTLLAIGGTIPQKLSTADNSVAFAARTASFGGGNVNKELFYTTGGDGYGTYTSVQKVALGGADISDTAFSFSQDGGRIFFADTTASKNFYSYSTGSTTTTDTGLDGVSAVAANSDGSRAAVVRTVGASQYVQIFNMADPSAPVLLATEDVTGLTVSNLSLNSAGGFAGYVVEGATDSFKTLLYTAADFSLTQQGKATLGDQTATEVSLSGDGSSVAYNVGFTGSTNEVFMSTIDGTTDNSYYFKAGQVQRSYVPGEDEEDVPRPAADEPLDQSLTTRGRATLADLTIKKLRAALEKDKERISAILESLGGKTVASLSSVEAVVEGVLDNMAESGKFHRLEPSVVIELLKD